MCKKFLAIFILISGSASAVAGEKATPQFVYAMGDILASEAHCGLTYDQTAIVEFIRKNVPVSDIGFAGRMNTATAASKRILSKQTVSEKTAQCAHIENIAREKQFIK